MSKTRQISPNVFVGGLNVDADPHITPNEDYIDATDIINGYGGQIGAIMFPRGNTKVAYTLPGVAADNKCIGCIEDKQTQSAIIFIYNANDEHRVLWWKPLDPLSQIRLLGEGSVFNFSSTQFISQAAVVDGKLVYWVDGQVIQGVMRGNPPRELDAETADVTDKDREYELYAGIPGEDQFQAGNEYTFKITNGTDILMEVTFTADGTYENDPSGGLEWLNTELAGSSLGPYLSLHFCECKLEISVLTEMVPEGYNILELTMVSATNGDIVLVGINFYPTPLQAFHLDLVKQPAHCAPSAEFVRSALTPLNNVEGICAQFIVRYIYRTGARSAWSPVSNIALNTDLSGEIIPSLNAIDVDFTDERLSDPAWLFMIRAVEVAFRDGNTNEFKLIDRFDVCEIGIQRQKITFLNDKLYQNVESDDLSTGVDTQVLKPFDSVPLISGALAIGADNNGNNLQFLGNNLEGYDCPDCVDMTVTAEEWNDECLIDIKGTVEIINNAAYPTADPDYSAYPLGGFVVYLAGTNYFAISNNPADGTGDGAFTIPKVPRGFYILRVASYKCSLTDDLGVRYNLSNGQEYQRTSAPVVDCAGSVAAGLNQFERLIDTTTIVGDFDLDVEVGYGPIQVLNAHYSTRDPEVASGDGVTNLHEMYLLDNEGLDTDRDVRVAALNCERQLIHFDGATSVDLDTDHNGYAYKMDVYEKGTLAVDVTVTVENIDTIPLLLIMYRGDYKEMYDDTLVETDDPGTIYESWGGGNYFIFNLDHQFTIRKRLLQTTAVDANGDDLPGVLFVYSRTTRRATSGIDGLIQILCYARWDDDYRDDDYLIANYPDDICYLHYPGNPVTIEDFRIAYLIGMNTDPKVVSDYAFSIVGGIPANLRFLKAGGIYDFGIVYEDEANRTCGVSKGPRLFVPFHINGLTRYQAKWSISSIPPDWAHHFRVVRTKNSLHQSYVQWNVSEVKYVRIPSDIEAPIDTTYAAGDYTHLLFRLFVRDPASTDDSLTLFWQQDGQEGYYPQQGDVVRLILNDQGEPVNTADILYQSEIVGTYIDGDGKVWAIVNASFGMLEIKPDFLVEYLTPRRNVEEVYYEGGEDCYDVLDPFFQNRRHSGPIQDQVIVDGVTTVPAQGMVTGGDTYWRRQLFTDTAAYITEHASPNRLINSSCEDIGRAFIYNPDAVQLLYYNRVRFSGSYLPNSKVNDFPSFGALDYQDMNRQWGQIKWMGFANNVLLAVCQFKIQPLYVKRGQIMFLGGETGVGRSDDVINIADASRSNYGSNNPESIVEENGLVYGWDGYNGVVWRYSQAGVDVITTNMIRYFRDLGRQRSENVPDFVLGGYDRRHTMYILAGLQTEKLPAFTIGYDEVKGRWVSRYNYQPEMMGRVGQEFVSFKNGELWRHHINNNFCNWYGVQYKPTVQFIVNAMPGMVKLFFSLRILTNRAWNAPAITTGRNLNYNTGMSSRLKSNKFQRIEGVLAADFLRDMNDTSPQFLAISNPTTRAATALLAGRNLRGEYMTITLEVDNGALDTRLTRVDTYYVPSEETNP